MTGGDAGGVLFPLGENGRRSTMATNRAVWADAGRPVDEDLAARISLAEPWRSEYLPHVRAVTERGARSADTAKRVAQSGLAAARARMVFRQEGVDHPLAEAPTLAPAVEFNTEIIEGTAEPSRELVVPYLGERLRGDALRRRIDAWIEGGIIEPSSATALETVVRNPDWLRLDGRRVAVLGAGAETSPLETLASWGVELLAIDLPRPAIWRRLLEVAGGGAGRVHVPVRDGDGDVASRAGANLITDVPETASWLRSFAEESPLVLGFYIYADGRSTSRRPWRLTPSPITWPAAATASGGRTRGRRAIATSPPRSSSRTASSVVASAVFANSGSSRSDSHRAAGSMPTPTPT